ncbi:MAG: 5'-methylthioadenosine/adenosylhomocysteine nucleosidase [Lachnospiraceae bacterium]|nr:5'-methylthioadenosine/adenosylhomocysteine nucleosidase [Lachnospiraceae bacterium]
MPKTTEGKDIKRIGIIAAMEEEIRILKMHMADSQIRSIAGTEYCFGKIGDYEVVLMQCGIGKVSAALGTQAMILEYQPDCIINTGCAGALAAGLKIGGMVVATQTVEWDIDMLAIGFPRGFVTTMNGVLMQADPAVSEWIAAAIPFDVQVSRGLVVSGDQFVSTPEQREIILGSFPDARCAEMEGGAIGHVCAQNAIPFAVVRCMSDTADGDSDVNFALFVKEAGEKSAEILLSLLSRETA